MFFAYICLRAFCWTISPGAVLCQPLGSLFSVTLLACLCRVEALMGHPPECLEGGGGTPAWVGVAGAWGAALSCPHQVSQLTSGSSKVPWLPCKVSIYMLALCTSLLPPCSAAETSFVSIQWPVEAAEDQPVMQSCTFSARLATTWLAAAAVANGKHLCARRLMASSELASANAGSF